MVCLKMLEKSSERLWACHEQTVTGPPRVWKGRREEVNMRGRLALLPLATQCKGGPLEYRQFRITVNVSLVND